MAIKTFNANRVGGGTFQIEQDAATGEYKIKEVGFIKLPELKLPELSTAELPAVPSPEVPTPEVPAVDDPFKKKDPKDDDRDPNINYQNYMRNLQRQAIGKEKVDTKTEDKAKQITKGMTAADIAYKNYEDTQKKYQDAIAANAPSPELRQLSLDVDKARDAIGNVPEQNVMLEDAAGNIQRPVDPITGAGRSQSLKFKERFDPTKIQAAEPRKNIVQRTLEGADNFIKNSASLQIGGNILKGGVTILENLAGMTDEQRALNETNKTALRSLGYATKAELGSSIDPGRIVKFDENGRQLSAADNVFVGMNRESIRGNVFEGAANRVKTRETIGIQRVEAKYGKDSQQAKDFRAKTETFKNQIKEAENERDNKQDTSPTKDDNNRGNMGMKDTSASTSARDRAMGAAGKLSGPPRDVRFR
jgi:hypothetical protein